jgi:hypothetical protein
MGGKKCAQTARARKRANPDASVGASLLTPDGEGDVDGWGTSPKFMSMLWQGLVRFLGACGYGCQWGANRGKESNFRKLRKTSETAPRFAMRDPKTASQRDIFGMCMPITISHHLQLFLGKGGRMGVPSLHFCALRRAQIRPNRRIARARNQPKKQLQTPTRPPLPKNRWK